MNKEVSQIIQTLEEKLHGQDNAHAQLLCMRLLILSSSS